MGDLREIYDAKLEEVGAEGLTKAEAYDVLCEAGKTVIPLDLANHYKKHDKKDDDLMTYEEVKAMGDDLGDPIEAMRKAFKLFDKDGNNKIDKEELRNILAAVDIFGAGTGNDEKFLEYTFKNGDVHEKDGLLDIDELLDMVRTGLLSV